MGFVDNQLFWSLAPIEPISCGLGRKTHCPQIKAKAGKTFIKMPKRVASDYF
jgi:hypothetical protein